MDTHPHDDATHHVVPVSLYLTIFTALMVLTAATVGVAYVDLGRANFLVALAIAVTKATLVILYFMHLRWSERLNLVFVATSLVWLVLLIGFIVSDPLTRDWVGTPARF